RLILHLTPSSTLFPYTTLFRSLPRQELEEMSVPSYGLTEVGICEEQMGEFTARLTVTGTTSTELVWVKVDGKVQRAVPASVKERSEEHTSELQSRFDLVCRLLL